MERSKPLVWLPADHRLLGEGADMVEFLVLGDKYARAVRDGAAAQAVMFPLADAGQIPALLALVDGVMLTGSPSNVDPAYFGQAVADPTLPLDGQRDALTLPLVRACLAGGVPLLGVCRGFQEINVALGGTLHQAVHDVPGLMDHREDESQSLDEQYAVRHEIRLAPGSAFERWAGGPEARVNSLHGQGIDRLADGLRALGHAPDGLVEACEVVGASAFAYAVQWHPEWRFWEHDFYTAIFRAFGQACAQHRRLREGARGAKNLAAEPAQY
ncbi:MAG: gamma-glutamyl-gamma-aminobutyrate hydrolase family protein [Hydrogenophaga sp.]|nr:gamma-glutamyl-gamma-aminobutyrate hydrolase family protein [Burkholderiaceae bacterium]MDZ4124131.1 gamma-glutamyl-gamma-aminobutyrate hydrolase family protein [Hydrogenophaga sp.]